ncbi:hypothetical protein AK830_g4611 [Neonectria ditissima]|uniref:Zn(2)-C6 fungal-type domain-containing protein n=1 Tax=Neonectria ditissima TaxID=78410 RepID=A0A0P7B7Z2_9HYPO|nr:hypothetical protein AK830_g4611 [Neonectria ditissima]
MHRNRNLLAILQGEEKDENQMSRQSRSPSTSRAGRVERSCVICHRRKVRCDKQSPCSQCARGGYSCLYPPAGPPVRRVRKTTITDVASRISELERTLKDVPLGLRPASPALGGRRDCSEPGVQAESDAGDGSRSDEVLLKKGSSSQYFNEVLFSRVIEQVSWLLCICIPSLSFVTVHVSTNRYIQEHDVRSALSTPRSHSPQPPTTSPFNPMGILSSRCFAQPLTAYLPSKLAAMQLWRVFVDSVDPCSKVLHIPTDEITIYTAIDNPGNATPEVLALCFAVYFSATVSLEPGDAAGILEGGDKVAWLHRFKKGVEQAFAHGEFLDSPTVGMLQAVAIYLCAVRVHNSGRGIWTLNGLVIRAAESIGLHRDGTKLALSPFESEMRRRLWWHLVARDGRAAEDHGLQNTSRCAMASGVDLPLNLEDSDLYPEMAQLPPPRPGWTRMTLSLVNLEVARAFAQLNQPGPPTTDAVSREQFFSRVVNEAKDKMAAVIGRCNYVVPQQRMTITVSRFILRKFELVSRQREMMNRADEGRPLATEANLLDALSVLDEAGHMWEDELLRPFRWSMRSYPQFHMMLYILWYLCVRPQGPSTARALSAVEKHLETARMTDAYTTHESKWVILVALKSKATAIMHAADRARAEGAAAATDDADAHVGAVPGIEVGPDGDGMLDWRTLLEDFQMDAADLSIL